VHIPLLRGLLADELLLLGGIAGDLGVDPHVLDHVLGRLDDHGAAIVEALAPGAPADLEKIADAEDGGLLPVVLAELGEEHGANGNVDADAEGVRPADDLEEALLRQLLHQKPILGEQARVVHADTVANELGELFPVGAVEAHAHQGGVDGLLLLLRGVVGAHQVLRLVGGGALAEVDEVDGRSIMVG